MTRHASFSLTLQKTTITYYVVQDEVQGYHWNKEQCTLHPVILYYKGRHQRSAVHFLVVPVE